MEKQKSTKGWKKGIIIFTCLAVVGGAAGFFSMNKPEERISSSKWESYSPRNSRFLIQFPKAPEATADRINVANTLVTYYHLSAEEKDSVYAITYLDFPGVWKLLGVKKLLNKTFTKMIEREKDVEQVLEREISSYKGYPALTFRYQKAGKELMGKFIVVGTTLYRISVTYPQSTTDNASSKAFLDSFQLKQ
ncbi:MAG: hypothetical protein KR126chlam1_00361 [Chlamydiae bacterium]|nr:hypothetical protein [Chlamydiota bacterium]